MRRNRCTTWLALLALLAPGISLGDGDGGTRSIFAQGAGNRALALGGAYTAVADDASGLLWNPGGLGWIQRSEIQFSRTSLYGLEMEENYLGVVFPGWRWGSPALSVRHFGVGQIEGRDARNQVTGEDLRSDDIELGLGYGRASGEAWSLGGTFKVRRQSVAGASATGIGTDLGFMVRPSDILSLDAIWLDGISLGLAVQNLLEPSLRLDRETVTDPRIWRAGVAHRQPLGESRSLLTAIDLETSEGIDPRIHLGFEMRLHPLVTLRSGLDHGALTAGTSVAWRDLTLDYAFDDRELGDSHRIGLSWRFGSTVEESRLAAALAAEDALNVRLADAFEQRQNERTEQMLSQAEEARLNGNTAEALDLLDLISTLAPDDERLSAMESRTWRDRAVELESRQEFAEAAVAFGHVLSLAPSDSSAQKGLDRCRKQSNERAARNQEIRQLFADALDAFTVGNLTEARSGFAQILELEPEDEEAAAMLERTRTAERVQASGLADQAAQLARAGRIDEASQTLARAQKLDPEARGVRAAEAEIRRATQRKTEQAQHTDPDSKRTETSKPASDRTQAKPEISPEKRKEIEALYKRGVEAIESGRAEDAIRYWELVLSEDPRHGQAQGHLKSEYLLRGMDAFAAGDLERAVGSWERAVQIDPTDPKARAYLDRAHAQLAKSREILSTRDQR